MRLIPARLWLLSIASGLLQVLPFPIAGPVPVWRTSFCWIALAPLLVALLGRDKKSEPLNWSQGALLGYVCGFVWYLGNCYWVYQTMYLYGGLPKTISAGILVLFCLYLGLYHALFGGLIAAIRRSGIARNQTLLLVPFVWVAVELARARVTGLPWDLLGITQVDSLVLTRLAPYAGAYGLSFVIALVNALWLTRITLRDRRFTRPVLTLAGVLLFVGYVALLHRTPAIDNTSATATLVQQNIEVGAASTGPQPTTKQLLDSFTDLSEHPSSTFLAGIPELPGTPEVVLLHSVPNPIQSEPMNGMPTDESSSSVARSSSAWTPHSDLIVWPESPAPGFQENNPEFRQAISSLAKSTGTPVIVGDIGIDRADSDPRGYHLYNSANFVDATGDFRGRYDKMHLVPFGEYVPYKALFFFAKSLLSEAGTFDAGKHRRVFSAGDHRYGIFICYESIFADEIRQYAGLGADVLVNISNDGWYGDTSAAWQHLNMVRMRAIEDHRWVLRATNTGVTAAIDPHGRVTMAAPRHIRTSLRVAFGYEQDLTFYARFGDLFAYLCALVTALVILRVYLQPLRQNRRPGSHG